MFNRGIQIGIKKKSNRHPIGKLFAVLQGLFSVVVAVLLLVLNILPLRYLILSGFIFIIFWIFAFFSQFTRNTHIYGKVLSVSMCIILVTGSYYLFVGNMMIDAVTDIEYKVDNIVAIVKETDAAVSLHDAANYKFGILENLDRDKVDETIDQYNEMIGQSISYTEYNDLRAMVDAFLDDEVEALIYNAAWTEPIDDLEKNFSKSIRILDVFEIQVVEETEEIQTEDKIVITEDPFIMYIAGIDEYGTLAATGRNDVNMLAFVNPNTKQVLLVITPRDFWVEFPDVTYGQRDKLTHAGNFGIRTTMKTMGEIYDVDVNYYLRVNFTSFRDIVDALGGINVYSEQDFTTRDGKYTFKEGYNQMNGKEALAFSRERFNLKEGDFQRGRNQQAVLTQMIKKAMSPSILTGYMGIMSSLEDNMEISMSKDRISRLVKMQLDDGADWTIHSLAAEGEMSSEYCYSLGSYASVVIPKEGSVEYIKRQIRRIMGGEEMKKIEKWDETEADETQETDIYGNSVYTGESSSDSSSETSNESSSSSPYQSENSSYGGAYY